MRDLNYLKRAANSAPFLLITTPFFLSGAEAQRPRASRGYSSKTSSETNLKDAFAALKVCTKELGEQEGLKKGKIDMFGLREKPRNSFSLNTRG